MIEKIKDILSDSIKILEENWLRTNSIKSVVINKDFFDNEYCIDFKSNIKSSYLKEQLQLIIAATGPVLYWFEFDDSIVDKNTIRESFIAYKDPLKKQFHHPAYRYASSYKKDFSKAKNILYVGKVEKGFYQRVKTHLGYATSPYTAGMQLHFWFGKNIDNFGNLTLNFIEFDPKMKDLISILEKKIAWELRPLIGKY